MVLGSSQGKGREARKSNFTQEKGSSEAAVVGTKANLANRP